MSNGKVITVRISEETHKRYKSAAHQAELSLNQFVIDAVERLIQLMEGRERRAESRRQSQGGTESEQPSPEKMSEVPEDVSVGRDREPDLQELPVRQQESG